ncbi:MAG: metalloregulator ArsR/SmtB family transcription factor [Leptospira sp.]|nr:metalloregulator ArsR/SmtB family transcription factor [Leptospira sp.]
MKKKQKIDAKKMHELFKTLSDPVKFRIVKILSCDKEIRAGDIALNFEVSRTTISHHLNSMRLRGLVNSKKRGKEIFYSLDRKMITGMLYGIISYLESKKE